MKRVEGSSLGIKSIANSNIWKTFKQVWNEDIGIMVLMDMAAICYLFRDKHSIFENGCVFLVFAGFLSLVIVESKNLFSKWNKSSKKGFLTTGNIIGLVFLGTLLAAGVYAILIIFNARSFLTINFLGIFGIIWTFRWIQKLKNFSSIRDNVHKLIGPLIAIVILISGYALRSKNTAFGPFSCVLAPAMMWIFSLIFGDIKGRSNDRDDEINPFAIIISIILLGLVIYAIRNPKIYGIEVMDIDGQFLKDLHSISNRHSDIDFYIGSLRNMEDRLEDLEDDEALVGKNSYEIRRINEEIENLKTNIIVQQGMLKNCEDKLDSLQLRVNLSEKFIEDPDLMIENLMKFKNTYVKPKPVTNTIISWLRRVLGRNEEEIDAD